MAKIIWTGKKEAEQIFHNSSVIIEHIGSTSVEKLGSKPVIDIIISLPDFSEAGNTVGLENSFSLLALNDKITDSLIGMCGLLSQEVQGQPELEIGYHLLPDW